MRISEVCRKYDITADTLRYYERIKLLPRIGRTSSGIRNYSKADCTWIEYIKCMRSAGVSVNALIEYVSLFEGMEDTVPVRKKILLEQREHLVNKIQELTNSLSRLDWKINSYEQGIAQFENKLNI
ncbi:MerR family transcriptional regulator [Anaerosporobacter faecicola]|uniref:MerR family transcriptional regulator n=1 Tax=Anaerosporobacter faecicola TaxID=2718714 RepID=UPI001438FFC8|nr:MerR family transcriptional regulator [Anaerosporobacter faecicola]